MSELNSEARQLLASAKRGTPVLDVARRVHLKGVVVAGTSAWAATAAASLSIPKVVIACLLSAALGSGVTWVAATKVTRRTEEPVAQPITAVQKPQTVPPEVPSAPPAKKPAVPVASSSPIEPPPAQPTPVFEPVVEPPPDTSFEAELAVLDVALTAIDEGRWRDGSAAIEQYRRRFPEGSLSIEASSLEVLVRCGEGRVEEASRLARLIEAQAPMNPTVQRLQQSCARH